MKWFNKKSISEANGSISGLALTDLYGKSCVDYEFSEKYLNQEAIQKQDNEEFISKANPDSDNSDARDAIFAAHEILEKTKIDRQAAEHRITNERLEDMAKRELSMIEVINSMLESNNDFLTEALYGKQE